MASEPCKSARLKVRVSPGSPRDRVAGRLGEEIKICLAAPPVDGKANGALVRYLAELLGVRSASVSIVAGLSCRSKVVRIEGLDREELDGRVEELLAGLGKG